MRRSQRRTPETAARELLIRAPYYQVATSSAEDEPVLRVLNGVLVGDWVLFHGALVGEKMACLGRRAVVSAYEAIVTIPSYFVDPNLACPATTYFRSVQAKGVIAELTDHGQRREMLTALMAKYQPEGGHAPFSDAAYDVELKRVRVFGVKIDELTGKANLGQDRPSERTNKIVCGLWQRGLPGECAAIEQILEESPEARPADWSFQVEGGELALRVDPRPSDIEAHAALLDGQYWRLESSREDMMTAIGRSTAWIGAVDSDGRLVAAARATTDDSWVANIFDVVVVPELRGQGVGRRVMELLLDHPAVRGCRFQKLGTKDAMVFYEGLGFKTGVPAGLSFVSQAMCRVARPS